MKERRTVLVEFPINVDKGDEGLWYVTSPVVRGLLIARCSEEGAIAEINGALARLAQAVDEASAAYGRLERSNRRRADEGAG